MKRKEKNKIFNLEQKTLNIIGIALSTLVIIAITIYYGIQLNREYINGDKKLPFVIEKNIYMDLKLADEKKNKIKGIILENFNVNNEFEDTSKIKIVPISEKIGGTKEDSNSENGKIEFKILDKTEEENSKIRVGIRVYHEKISEKKVKKDEIVTYGKGLIDNNNDVEKYNLSKINFKVTIIMENNEEYETIINLDKIGMERKEFGLFKEENGKKVKITKKYLQN